MKTTRDDILNGWLKYHNTNVEKVIEKYPEEIKSPEWFKLFPCTQEQCDEWENWAKALLKKKDKLRNWEIDRMWGFIYLDCSPYVK
jgi:hypothetical protein